MLYGILERSASPNCRAKQFRMPQNAVEWLMRHYAIFGLSEARDSRYSKWTTGTETRREDGKQGIPNYQESSWRGQTKSPGTYVPGLVREIRVELTRPFGHYLLRVARLPIPPSARLSGLQRYEDFSNLQIFSLFLYPSIADQDDESLLQFCGPVYLRYRLCHSYTAASSWS